MNKIKDFLLGAKKAIKDFVDLFQKNHTDTVAHYGGGAFVYLVARFITQFWYPKETSQGISMVAVVFAALIKEIFVDAFIRDGQADAIDAFATIMGGLSMLYMENI